MNIKLLFAATYICLNLGALSMQDPPYYEEQVSASDPIRTEQAKELDAYIQGLKNDTSRLELLFKPDFSSTAAYLNST